MNTKLLTASLLVGIVMLNGCATILGGGSNQTISVNSNNQMKGTMKYADGSGVQHFTTPATLFADIILW